MQYSEEQLKVIQSEGDLKVNAVAGSGKTSTLMAYAAHRPKMKILYLAFNKSVKIEAEHKLKQLGISNVAVATAHSLALSFLRGRNLTINHNGYNAFQLRSLLKIHMKDLITEMRFCKHVLGLSSFFCNSNAQRVVDVDYAGTLSDVNEIAFWAKHHDKLILETRRFLGEMRAQKIEATHEYYLKEFQLQSPKYNYDVIFFDEGQDASPVMLDVFLNQKCTKVIVGDEFQQIYGWRYAENALKQVPFDRLALNTSFRFQQPIADLSIEILKTKVHVNDGNTDFAVPAIKGMGKSTSLTNHAILGRTNSGILVRAINMLEDKEVKKVYFEGNFNSYAYADEGGSIYDVLDLYLGKKRSIRDPLIKSFSDFVDLEQYADQTGDTGLKGVIDLVKNYKKELPKLIKKIKDHHVDDKDKLKADVIFSTVHKAKGMEYDEVTLLADFLGEEKLKAVVERFGDEVDLKKLDEDINILYVATTRAKTKLNIPDVLLPLSMKDKVLKGVEIIKTEKTPQVSESDFFYNFNPAPKLEKSKKTSQKPTSANKKWSDSEDLELKMAFGKDVPLKQIADDFGRTYGAIHSRLKKLGLKE
jgi:F-box protein, helicase, 18